MTDLCKEEYETLRKEVETAMAELNTLESGALVAVAAIFAWLVTHRYDALISLGWFIPLVLVLFCILRVWTISRHLGWLGEYLKQHEALHVQPRLPGWEHFLEARPPGSTRSRRGARGQVTLIFWLAMVVASLGMGALGYAYAPAASETEKSAPGA